jgi:hypothetical protein
LSDRLLIVAAHLRDQDKLQPDDYTRFQVGKFDGAVVMWYQDPLEVLALGVDPRDCVVRLNDSIFTEGHTDERGKWVIDRHFVPSFWALAEVWEATIARWAAYGFVWFQIDNEPNESWIEHGNAPGQWAWLIDSALRGGTKDDGTREPGLVHRLTKRALWGTVFLGMTPFSVTDKDLWLRAALRFAEFVQFVCDHCYWQKSDDMKADWAGLSFVKVYKHFGYKRIKVTECGNSCGRPPSSRPLPEVRARQVADYPAYVEEVRKYDYVDLLAFYLLGEGGTWPDFDLTEEICERLGARPAAAPQRAGVSPAPGGRAMRGHLAM